MRREIPLLKRYAPTMLAMVFTLILMAVPAVDAADVTSAWIGDTLGVWGTAGNWNPAVIPDNGSDIYHVVISDTLGSEVQVDGSYEVDSLFIGPGNQVTVTNANRLYLSAGNLNGILDNRGLVQIDALASHTYFLLSDSTVTFIGGGTVSCSDSPWNWMYASGSGSLNNVDNTIRGALNLGYNNMAITNSGTLIADAAVNEFMIDPSTAGGMINTGTVKAENGGTLQLLGGAYDNTGGVIEALDGSAVEMSGSAVTGGTLQTTGSGVIRSINSNPRLADLTLDGAIDIPDSRRIYLLGTIENNSAITLSSTGNHTYLHVETGPVSLTGGGTISCSDEASNWLYASGGGSLVNVDNTIRGALNLGYNNMAITNSGTLIADAAVNEFKIDPSTAGGMINTGTVKAENGGTLQLLGGAYDNTGGVIEALDGSVVEMNGSTVTGGTLQTTGSGVIRSISSNPRLADLTLDGAIDIPDSRRIYLLGTIENNSAITLSSTGNHTFLHVETGPVSLTGGGTITCSDEASNWLYASGGGSLVNVDNTIRGALNLGNNTMAITNSGTFIADATTNAFKIDPSTAGFFLNSGSLQVTGAGGMQILNGTMDQQGTVAIDSGMTLTRTGDFTQTAGTTTVSGALTLLSNGEFDLQGGTLGGSGAISGDVVNSGGSVAPGLSAGTLSVTGDYVQGAGGSLDIEIGGFVPGTEHDVLAITGDATLAGAVSITPINGYVPVVDDSFVVLTATNVTGGFDAPFVPVAPGIVAGVAPRNGYVVVLMQAVTDVATPEAGESAPIFQPLTVYPNPTRVGNLSMSFQLPYGRSDIDLAVYDIAGRRVKTIAAGAIGASAQQLRWNGRDQSGEQVASGTYFARLTSSTGYSEVRRFVVVR